MRNIFFMGYIFTCGHGCPPDAIMPEDERAKRKDKRILCPVCGQHGYKKVYKCSECGAYFKTGSRGGVARVCGACRKDLRYMSNVAKKNKAARRKIKNKPLFDQTRRGECKWGTYCIDQQLKKGIEFNCHGCRRFELLSLDVLDYMSTGVDILARGCEMLNT